MTDLTTRDASPRKFRRIPGEQNSMAVCGTCDRHAGETRMTHYCADVIEGKPFTCDECRMVTTRVLAVIREAIKHRHWLREVPFDEDTELSEIADSLDRQTIGFGVEEITGCEISEREVMRWRTVADVIATVRAAVAAEARRDIEEVNT